MKKLFENTSTECIKCKTPLQGSEVKFISDEAYCNEHYEKELEKSDNDKKQNEMNWFTKHFDTSR